MIALNTKGQPNENVARIPDGLPDSDLCVVGVDPAAKGKDIQAMRIKKTAESFQEFKEFYHQMLLLHSTGLKLRRCVFEATLVED